jgi:biopolymer transport protein ExbD
MSMQTTGDNAEGEPMIDMNVTPLIDVMLVLLIMFIITIPVQTHAVKLDLPVNQQNQPPPPIQPLKNTVGVTARARSRGTAVRSARTNFAIIWKRRSR